MHEKDKLNSNGKELAADNSSNINSSNSINNSINNTNTNIQNINNIVGCNTNSTNATDSSQNSANQISTNSNNACNTEAQDRVNTPSTNLQNINTIILAGIEAAESMQSQLSQTNSTSDSSKSSNTTTSTTNTSDTSDNPTCSITDSIDKASTTLQNINNIKLQLARLDLDPRQLAYYENSIVPLLTTLRELSVTSVNLATSAYYLSTSIIVSAKNSKIKDTIHLVYDMNEDCEDVYKSLKKKIDILLDLG